MQVFNDLQRDVAENIQFVRDSEAAREELQDEITAIAERINEDTALKEKYQNSLIAEIQELKNQIQDMHREASAAK